MNMNDIKIRRSRFFYIIEAALEYFISILVAGSYLATLTAELGISDGLTGVISSFISLGCLFQLLSVFLKRPRVKGIVIALSVLNQLLFLLLYLIPLAGGGKQVKIAVFMIAIFLAYLIYNSVHPLKINWLMSLCEDKKRGVFTSQKEIVSLLSGMIFSFATGTMIDHYKAKGEIETAFLLCGVTVFVLILLHTFTMLFSVEIPVESGESGTRKNPLREMLGTLQDKTVVKVTVLFVIWHLATSSATPFYGTYLIKELGFSLQFVSILSIVYSLVRASVSTFWGKYADKNSFASMVRLCLLIAGIGFLVNVFTVPSNGAVFYTIYYALYAVAMGGINSALTNLVFDYVAPDTRSNALALSQAVSGVVGFVTTLIVSGLVTHIQNGGNTLFGIPVYAQQVVSAIAFVFTMAAVAYVTAVIIPVKGQKK
ncbi:MAG: MFS transporter [Clostridia bacterium]|nr:MFS transporter [Clostridia bacterium]